MRRYDAGAISLSAIVGAWERHVIDAVEFGRIIGEAS